MAAVLVNRVPPRPPASGAAFVVMAPVEGGTSGGSGFVGTATLAAPKKVAAVGGTCTAGTRGQEVRQVAGATGRSTMGATAVGAGRKVAAVGGRSVVAAAGMHTAIDTGPFTHVTVTCDYDLATGAAPSGTVTFTPSAWLVNNGVTVVAAPVAAALDVTGVISIDLAANTDPGTSPTGSHYTVREDIFGQPRRTYQVIIPHDAGSPIELSGLPVLS